MLNLKVSVRWGWMPRSWNSRWTVAGLIGVRFATSRTLQWVVPSGGGLIARACTRSRSSRVYVGG